MKMHAMRHQRFCVGVLGRMLVEAGVANSIVNREEARVKSKRVGRIGLIGLSLIASQALAASITFEFEGAGDGPDLEWGSAAGFPLYVNQGFQIDVAASSAPHGGLHWHETNSIFNPKVPDRPAGQAGVLWRDSDNPGQDPLTFSPVDPSNAFTLNSLVVGASSADGSQTTAIRLSGFRGGSLLGTVDLQTVLDAYLSYSNSSLGPLQGVLLDRLEIVGLSNSDLAYFMLDDVSIATVPEPSAYLLVVAGLGLLLLRSRVGAA